MAKGATYEEATRLHELKQKDQMREQQQNNIHQSRIQNHNDEDEFLKRYREKRLQELKKEKFGSVIPIARDEWNHEVNESSEDGTWVVIYLSAQKSSPNLHPMHKDLCNLVGDEMLPILAQKNPATKFVSIPSSSAIENWPEANLPTIFCYRYGKLQSQIVGLKEFGVFGSRDVIRFEYVERALGKLGVIPLQDDDNYLDEKDLDGDHSLPMNGKEYGKSHFGGMMAKMDTGDCIDDDESDYDDID
jgi:hypothetical protein